MLNLNQVFIMGNLTRDAEAKTLQTGTTVTKFSVANNRPYTVNGEKREDVTFVDVETWGKLAETCGCLQKGAQVLVVGRLKTESWTAQDGSQRTKLIISALEVQFGPRPAGAQDGQGAGYNQPQGGYPPPQQSYQQPQQPHHGQNPPQHGYAPAGGYAAPPTAPHGHQPPPQGGYAPPHPGGGHQY